MIGRAIIDIFFGRFLRSEIGNIVAGTLVMGIGFIDLTGSNSRNAEQHFWTILAGMLIICIGIIRIVRDYLKKRKTQQQKPERRYSIAAKNKS